MYDSYPSCLLGKPKNWRGTLPDAIIGDISKLLDVEIRIGEFVF